MEKMRFYEAIISKTVVAEVTANSIVSVLGTYSTTAAPLGVAIFPAAAGSKASIQQTGIAVVVAGGTITAGAVLASNSTGKAVALTLSTPADIVKLAGYAIDAGSTGDLINIKLA